MTLYESLHPSLVTVLREAAAHYNAHPESDGRIVVEVARPHHHQLQYREGGGHLLTTRDVLTYARRLGFKPATPALKRLDATEAALNAIKNRRFFVYPDTKALIEQIRATEYPKSDFADALHYSIGLYPRTQFATPEEHQ